MTPSERLEQITLKIDRAKAHCENLQLSVEQFFASGPYKIAHARDEQRRPVYYLESVEPTPHSLCLIAGDVIQNLRTALDHLAYQIVCKDTSDNPPKPTAIFFPISDSEADHNKDKARKLLGASSASIAAIDAIKPYKGGNDSLWILNRLNNIEKHRTLLAVGSYAAGIHIGSLMMPMSKQLWSIMDIPENALQGGIDHLMGTQAFMMPTVNQFPLTAGFELLRDGPDMDINEHLTFRFDLVLHEPGIVEGQPLVPFLVQLFSNVEQVVSSLTSLLE